MLWKKDKWNLNLNLNYLFYWSGPEGLKNIPKCVYPARTAGFWTILEEVPFFCYGKNWTFLTSRGPRSIWKKYPFILVFLATHAYSIYIWLRPREQCPWYSMMQLQLEYQYYLCFPCGFASRVKLFISTTSCISQSTQNVTVRVRTETMQHFLLTIDSDIKSCSFY